nr:Packaging protein [Ipomoea batatas]
MMDPKTDKLVRRTTMVATAVASYFLLTADYGPEPNAIDPLSLSLSLLPYRRDAVAPRVIGRVEVQMSGQTVAETQGSQDEEELEEEELGNLEEEVTQMAEKVAEYRATLPDQLKTTLASLLAAQRPALQMHFDVGSLPQPGSSNAPASDLGPVESETLGTLTEEEQEETEKVQLLKQKILSNASAIPIVLKRMKESMSRIDKLESHNGFIHPAFKRKRTS